MPASAERSTAARHRLAAALDREVALPASSCTERISPPISLVLASTRSARSLISSATTLNARPWSPDCAAMIRRVQREQIRLVRDVVDHVHDCADLHRARTQVADHRLGGLGRLADRLHSRAIVSRTFMRPLSARSTTRCESRTASAAEVSTSRSEVAISSIEAEVSSRVGERLGILHTCFTERTICSIELETSSTFDREQARGLVQFLTRRAELEIELLDSSMLSFSAELDCAMPTPAR